MEKCVRDGIKERNASSLDNVRQMYTFLSQQNGMIDDKVPRLWNSYISLTNATNPESSSFLNIYTALKRH